MGMRSNMFANIENKFEFADKETITTIALNSLGEMLDAMGDFKDNTKFGVMVLGARLGVAGDGIINAQEKELINEVFGKVWKGSMDDIYNMLGADIEESDYSLVQDLTQLGNAVAMPFLNYVLSFAYIDGKIEDDVAERLDGLFGMNLLTDFFQSGQEEVPAPQIRLTDLEAEIVKWFKSDNQLRLLDDIVAHFPDKSRSEVQQALDSLVEKGVLYGGASINKRVSNMYWLAYEHYKNDEPVEDELPDELEIDGTSKVQNAAEQVIQKQQLEGLVDELNNLMGDLENAAAEAGTDLHPSNIGETGFDLYKWTFTQGKRKEGKGWSIAIPDGFTVIESKYRLFEAVPEGFKNEKDSDKVPVQILPGVELASTLKKEMWMHHQYARMGVAAIVGEQMAIQTARMMGIQTEVISCAFEDLMAFSLIQDTTRGSYSYHCTVITSDKTQAVRVQTSCVTDEQKKTLTKSVLEWISTFRFDKPNSFYPKEPAIAAAKVLTDLKRGVTTSFDSAVESAQREYNACVNGRIRSLQYMADNGLLNEDAPNTVRTILTDGMTVKEFYHEEADKLIEELKAAKVGASVMNKVYKKLKELEEGTTEFTVDEKKITVTITARTKEIQKKWKEEAAEISKIEKTEAEAERKCKEEEKRKADEARKKAEAEAKAKREEALRKYNEEYKKWESDCKAIKAKRSAYVNEKIAAAKKSLEDAATKKRDDAVSKANATISSETSRKQTAEATLASLGLFKFGEKRNQKAVIEDATRKISDAQRALSAAESAYKSEMAAADKTANNKAITFRNAAAKEYPMPVEPKKTV